jgi:hypothetical protein
VKTTTTTIQRFGKITAEDPTLVFRAVGTLEYLSALRDLDAFVRVATREELDAADRIVSSRPQFTIYSRLADRQRGIPAPSDAQRQGLRWVIALARLEAGAILATFTKNAAPFEDVGPSRFELPAFQELLMDAAQTHVLALANDARVHVVAAKNPDNEMLAYIRRLTLARALLSAAARSNASHLSVQDWLRLEEQDRQLLAIRDLFAMRVRRFVDSLNSNLTNKTVTEKEKSVIVSSICPPLLEAERRELKAGTAKVQTFRVR